MIAELRNILPEIQRIFRSFNAMDGGVAENEV